MRHFIIAASSLALLAACNQSSEISDGTAPVETRQVATSTDYDIEAQYKKFAEVKMDVDTSFLSESERAVVNKLIENIENACQKDSTLDTLKELCEVKTLSEY